MQQGVKVSESIVLEFFFNSDSKKHSENGAYPLTGKFVRYLAVEGAVRS